MAALSLVPPIDMGLQVVWGTKTVPLIDLIWPPTCMKKRWSATEVYVWQ